MPLYKVNFENNIPSSAAEVAADDYNTLKEFATTDGQTTIKWYIVHATTEQHACEMAEKLVYQMWGHILFKDSKS